MGKPLHESMAELDAAVADLKAELWRGRWEILPYLVGAWLIITAVVIAATGL